MYKQDLPEWTDVYCQRGYGSILVMCQKSLSLLLSWTEIWSSALRMNKGTCFPACPLLHCHIQDLDLTHTKKRIKKQDQK